MKAAIAAIKDKYNPIPLSGHSPISQRLNSKKLRNAHTAMKAAVKRLNLGATLPGTRNKIPVNIAIIIFSLPGSPKREPAVLSPVNIICLLSTVNQGRKALIITITTNINPKILALDIRCFIWLPEGNVVLNK